jgi:hypothetical protein
MKQHAYLLTQFALGIGCFAALRYFGILSGWPNIPTPVGKIPLSGDTLQVLISGVAAYSPNLLGNVISQQWMSDVVAAPTRIRELHAVKGTLVSGATAANALGLTGTVVTKPVEAEKPATGEA